MKNSKIAAAAFFLATGLFAAALSASAQTSSAPMVVKQTTLKKVWLKAVVIHADGNLLIVREQANERTIHSFTYDSKIKAKMQQIADNGGYQTGDKVKILYVPGQDVALKVRGKPSKSP